MGTVVNATPASSHGLLAPFVCPVLALIVCCLTGCAPSLSYDVDLREARTGDVAVRMRVRRAAGDSIVLRGYGTGAEMRIHGVEVDAKGSSGFVVDSLPSGAGFAPRIVIRGPLPSSLTVRYRVTPGAREGDAHVGWTGRSFGEVHEHGMFATGRGLFLYPARSGRIERIATHFKEPRGWDVIAPWHHDEGAWRPGVNRRFAAEDLLGSALGFGAFHMHTERVGATDYRLAIDARIGRAERDRTVDALVRVIHVVHGAIGRGPGGRYTIVVMPESNTGDALVGSGWASGQGGTLSPVTASRLHGFARRLIDAHLVHAPYRVAPHDAREQWVMEGFGEVLAWRAVARAGFADEAQIARDFAGAYAEALDRGEADGGLEEPDPDPVRAEVIAPLALLCLERELTRAGGDGLDPVFRAMFARTDQAAVRAVGMPVAARSLWTLIPPAQRAAAATFRERHVEGLEPLPASSFFDFDAATPEPIPPRGPVRRAITLAFSGNAQGYLENCGCKAGQAGGVARRATVLARLRAKGPVLAIDAGSAFPRSGRRFGTDTLAALEQQLYLAAVRAMRFEAAVIGETELAQDPEFLRREVAGSGLPWVLGNVRRDDAPLAPAARIARVGGLRVAVIGLFDAPRGREWNADYERRSVRLDIENPIEVLRRELPKLRTGADLVVAAGRFEPATIRDLVAACPDLDVVISTVDRAVRHTTEDGEETVTDADPSGFVGRTLVLYATLDSYGLGSAALGLDAANRIARADVAATWLGDEVPDDPAVRSMLTRFYQRVGASAAAEGSVPALFAHDALRQTGTYVGGENCAGCHAAQTAQWKGTRHADAWKTLLDAHRHYQPRCVACHVVGFGTPSGYRVGDSGNRLVNVQCEVCHGPGGQHVMAPARDNIQKAVPAEVCLECHTPEHSDHFVYADRLPRVMHAAHAVTAADSSR